MSLTSAVKELSSSSSPESLAASVSKGFFSFGKTATFTFSSAGIFAAAFASFRAVA